jgi:hypothetical protein
MDSRHEDPIWQEGEESVRSSVDVLSDQVRVRAGVLGSTVHLRCPRCGLAMLARPRWIAAKHCPRCVARAHKLVELLTDSAETDRLILPLTLDGADCTESTR